jgi:hypothetical protein
MAVVTVGSSPTTETRKTTAGNQAAVRFAVFDLDRTLLPGSSLGLFARELARA